MRCIATFGAASSQYGYRRHFLDYVNQMICPSVWPLLQELSTAVMSALRATTSRAISDASASG